MALGRRRARPAVGDDVCGMFRLFILVAPVVLIAVRLGGSAAAQTPPATPTPVPVGPLKLEQTAPGAYRLSGAGMAPAAPYRVAARVWAIGTDHGVVIDLGQFDDDRFAIDLPLPLSGMTQAGCYHVAFSAAPDPKGGGPPEPSISLQTHACIGDGGLVTFPAYDGVQSPPPAAPSDVRVVPLGDDWEIAWRDNSDDEIAFDPGVLLFDRPWSPVSSDATLLGAIDIPEVAADWTLAGGLNSWFAPQEPREYTCGYALVLVFAVGGDAPSLPGNTTVPACFGAGRIAFPETGQGGAIAVPPGRATSAATLLAAVGIVAYTMGALAGVMRRASSR